MKEKKVIAILADFPAVWVDASLSQQGWHHAPAWLAHVRDFFVGAEEYEAHWIIFSPAVRLKGAQTYQRWNQTFHILPRYSLKWDQRTHYLYARCAAGHLLKKLQPDIVHAWGTEAEYAVAALGYKGFKILSMQGIISAILQRSPMGAHFCRQQQYELQAMKEYDVITAESTWGCDRVRELVPEKMIVRCEYAPDVICFEQQWQPDEAPCCILAGSDTYNKNIHTAIDVFSSPELSHVTLYMAGIEAENHPGLPDNIKPLGGLSRTELLKYMGRSWCLVHPSFADTSPNVVKEARVIGLPVVVSCETGGTQYVVDGKSGYTFNPHDAEAFKQCVCSVVSSRENALKMGQYQHELVRNALSAAAMHERLTALYSLGNSAK